jgi:hypothetical protein
MEDRQVGKQGERRRVYIKQLHIATRHIGDSQEPAPGQSADVHRDHWQ